MVRNINKDSAGEEFKKMVLFFEIHSCIKSNQLRLTNIEGSSE
jgi:hypothetical protein